MSTDIKLPFWKQLSIIEVYTFYDRPVLYCAQSETDRKYIILLADESDTSEDWLYVEISNSRLNQIRSGRLTLRSAFTNAETGSLLRVNIPANLEEKVTFKHVSANELDLSELPNEDERLQLYAPTLPKAPRLVELQIEAKQNWREILLLRLKPTNEFLTEIASDILGSILKATQKFVETTFVLNSKSHNKRLNGVLVTPTLNVTRVGASSFAVELASVSSGNLFGETDISKAIEEIISLIQIQSNEKLLTEKIKSLPPKVIGAYAGFLKSLEKGINNTQIDWASPYHETAITTSFTQPEVIATLQLIERTEFREPEMLDIQGALVGANLRSKKFEIHSKDDQDQPKNYGGQIEDHALNELRNVKLGSTCRVSIKRIDKVDFATGEIESKFSLVKITNLDWP